MHRQVIVRGRVQGVFFRASCQQEASRLGVSGWVANQPDGSVEAVFEGSSDAVAAMIEWCHRGPAHAEVDSVDVAEGAPTGIAGFEVR